MIDWSKVKTGKDWQNRTDQIVDEIIYESLKIDLQRSNRGVHESVLESLK